LQAKPGWLTFPPLSGYAEAVNSFLALVQSGELSSLDDLRGFYKTEVKRLHPDLNGTVGPRVDFDRLKHDYAEAYRHLLARLDQTAPSELPGSDALEREAYLDEIRNLVARGFPVNVQAASKNRAYTASIRQVSKYLEARFHDAEFFPKTNREARHLKRHHPRIHWYVLQIFWNLGDWRVTGFDYYRRIFLRHWNFIQETLADEGFLTLRRLLEDLVEG
jgi:hypothetical protein